MGETPRYGLLLLAVSATFFFQGVAGPGDLQRVVGTILVAATLLLALYAAEVSRRRLRVMGVLAVAIVVGVLVASLASDNTAAIGLVAIADALLVALAPLKHPRDCGGSRAGRGASGEGRIGSYVQTTEVPA